MSDSDDEQEPVKYVFRDFELMISTAENEFNKGKKTLFATYVWSGSVVLCNKLIEAFQDEIQGKRVVEFGAAAGIPSIVAAKLGAERVVSTDYPSKSVIRNLRRNCQRNGVENVVQVGEYIWGEDVAPVIAANEGDYFDVALATECLWRHESHASLVSSVLGLLKPGGIFLMTYSHHVPGFEEQDDEFLVIAEANGLTKDSVVEIEAPHMWSDEKMSTLYLVKFIKR